MESIKRDSMRANSNTKLGKVEACISESSKKLFDNLCKLNGNHLLKR